MNDKIFDLDFFVRALIKVLSTPPLKPYKILFLVDIFDDKINKEWDEKEKKNKRKVSESRFCDELIEEDKCIAAWEILFPDSDSKETTVEYIVNEPYQREYIDNYDEDDEDDEEDEFFEGE